MSLGTSAFDDVTGRPPGGPDVRVSATMTSLIVKWRWGGGSVVAHDPTDAHGH